LHANLRRQLVNFLQHPLIKEENLKTKMGQIQNLYEIKEKQCAKKRNGKEEEK